MLKKELISDSENQVKKSNEIDVYFNKYFYNKVKEYKRIRLGLDGPFRDFDSKKIQYSIVGEYFKPNSDHKKYSNLLGENCIIINFDKHFIVNEKAIYSRIDIAIKILEILCSEKIYHEEGKIIKNRIDC